jgi:zinc transport system substrate-binding protein
MCSSKRLFLLFIILILLLAGSFSAAAAEAAVAVTIVPQLEMVEAIAGDRVEAVEMIPRGFSPSNYAPSPAEMRAFNEASIYFSMGVPADMQNILPRAEEMSGLKVVKLFERIESKYPHRYFGDKEKAGEDAEDEYQEDENDDHGHSHQGGRDPHIWLSPARVSLMVEIMRDELIEILPKELLAEYQGQEILVYHPSFGYFTEHYGLEMLAIEKEGKEPGPRYLQEIIKYARQQGIKNVFYQAEIDSSRARAAAEELGGEIIQLNPLAPNYLDNLKVMAEKIAAVLAERDDQ